MVLHCFVFLVSFRSLFLFSVVCVRLSVLFFLYFGDAFTFRFLVCDFFSKSALGRQCCVFLIGCVFWFFVLGVAFVFVLCYCVEPCSAVRCQLSFSDVYFSRMFVLSLVSHIAVVEK